MNKVKEELQQSAKEKQSERRGDDVFNFDTHRTHLIGLPWKKTLFQTSERIDNALIAKHELRGNVLDLFCTSYGSDIWAMTSARWL